LITCRELIEFLIDYRDGNLPPEQKAEFERHLTCCGPCVAYMKTYEQAILLAKRCCRDDSPAAADVPEELVKAILAARRR
jgi:anti-sigma factor RsiW